MGDISYPLSTHGWLVWFFTPQPSNLISSSPQARAGSQQALSVCTHAGRFWEEGALHIVLIVVVAKRKSVQRRGLTRLKQEVSESLDNHCT